MKIGILTFHNALNQGAVLQAYALQTYIEKLGHEVEFIDYHPCHHYSLKKDFLAKSWAMMTYKWQNVYNGIKYTRRNNFSKVLHISPTRYTSFQELKSNPPQYDLYICGSDQIWHFPKQLNPVYLMDFLPNGAKMISYAASIGQNFPPPDTVPVLRLSLSRYKGLSLREDKAVDYMCSIFHGQREICQSVDPTLLLSSSEYDNISEHITINNEYIATYILSLMESGHYDVICKATDTLQAEIINLRNPDTCSVLKGYKNKIVTPYQWLSYIKGAKAVICSSFHAVAFSLLFHKPFILIQPESLREKGGNLRVMSLLKPLGLCSHCIYNADESNVEQLLNEKIDWRKVDETIASMVESSKEYLNSYLI